MDTRSLSEADRTLYVEVKQAGKRGIVGVSDAVQNLMKLGLVEAFTAKNGRGYETRYRIAAK